LNEGTTAGCALMGVSIQKFSNKSVVAYNQAHPSELEVSEVLTQFRKGSFESTELLAKALTQKYPHHQLAWKILGIVFKRLDG